MPEIIDSTEIEIDDSLDTEYEHYFEQPVYLNVESDFTDTNSILTALLDSQEQFYSLILQDSKNNNDMLLTSLEHYKMTNSLMLIVIFVLMFINFKEYVRGWLS